MSQAEKGRVNPFKALSSDSLDDFQPKAKSGEGAIPTKELIDEVAKEAGFPSRQAAQEEKQLRKSRRYRTGRNIQLNVKVDQDTWDRFARLCDLMPKVTQGEIIQMAITLLEEKNASNNG